MTKGVFITFEGGEGCGKSTQTALLARALAQSGLPHVVTREPGGTPGAEHIRALLVQAGDSDWDAETETLLFYAARLDHVNKKIKPALAEGKLVLCDRFADSTIVYQGAGRGVAQHAIAMLHGLTLGDFSPNLTLIFDLDPRIGLTRTRARAGDETRFEEMGNEFHAKVRAGFLAIAQAEPERCVVLNADQDISVLHRQVVEAIRRKTGMALEPVHA